MKVECLGYLSTIAEWNWWNSFPDNLVEAVHERIKLKFHDWKLSSDGFDTKK